MTTLLIKTFIKNPEDVKDARVRSAYGTMVSVVCIVLNLLVAAGKIAMGALFGAISIMADGMNNLSDAGSSLVSLISFRMAAKPADREHPFGHARIEYVASLLVSVIIILVGWTLFTDSIGTLVELLQSTEPASVSDAGWLTYAVLGVSIAVKLWMFFFNRKIAKKIDSSVMRATATDCISDAGATLGVLAAQIAAFYLGLPWLDSAVGIAISVLIIIAGIRVLGETKNSILGEAPDGEVVDGIKALVGEYPEALGIHDLMVHSYGPGHHIASLHVEVDGEADVYHTHDVIDNIEKRLHAELGIIATIHMDPIVTNDERVNALRERTGALIKEIDAGLSMHDFRVVAGPSHTNLIFDIEAPFECKLSEAEIKQAVADRLSGWEGTFFAVITVDRQ
ncbi:MAG: cation transporter [Ruminococcaceae bacterium]|nr:cation transporter [Oscillospiraceae bacterium]